MLEGISEDINAVVDWELAHGNALDGVYCPTGVTVVALVRPVRQSHDGAPRELPATLKPWEFRDSHYAESEWLAGFKSTETGQVVCGPMT